MDATTVERLDRFSSLKWDMDEFYEMKTDAKKLEKYMSEQRIWVEQQYMNDVLAATYVKLDKIYHKNAIGPIMKPDVFNALSDLEKEQMKRPMTSNIKMADGQMADIDNNIAYYISSLNEEGVTTGQSCSGTISDHRFVRFDSDDPYGRWMQGELVHQKDECCHAYLTLPVEKNHPELIKAVMADAESWGWIVGQKQMDGVDSVILSLPHTLDGSSFESIREEALEQAEHHSQLYGMDDMKQAEVEMMAEVEYEHGGRIHYTDMIKNSKWADLNYNLRNLQEKVNKSIRQQNIDEGRAFTLYFYNSEETTLTADQLADVFRRSGMTLDKDSVYETPHTYRYQNRATSFIASHDGNVRMMLKDEEFPHKLLIKERLNLSTLMASQMRSTIYGGEDPVGKYYINVMIHPDPKDLETIEKFTIRKPVDEFSYYKYMGENVDTNLCMGNLYCEELYRAAVDAYENSMDRKIEDVKLLQAVSDIRIRKGIDGNVYIGCNVYGERQLAKRMKDSDIEYYRMRMSRSDKAYNGVAPELAQKYFAKEIEAGSQNREQVQGMKR